MGDLIDTTQQSSDCDKYEIHIAVLHSISSFHLAVPSAMAATTHWLGAGSAVMATIGLFRGWSKVPRERVETGSHNWKKEKNQYHLSTNVVRYCDCIRSAFNTTKNRDL